MSLTTRGRVRTTAFLAAGIIGISVFAVGNYYRAKEAEYQLNLTYLHAAEDLATSLDNIKNTLTKGLYSNSADTLTEYAAKLRGDASAAKVYMAQLPTNQIDLSDAYKFLSQVGNYSDSMARKMRDDEEITEEDKQNALALYDLAKGVSDAMWNVELQIREGYISFNALDNIDDKSDTNAGGGFADIEGGFDNYPTLIYDGPFSDHIMQKEPLMLKNETQISAEKAAEKAKLVLKSSGSSANPDSLKLTDGGEEGKMPSYLFKDGNRTVSVTKNGGLFVYMLNYRPINAEKKNLTAEAAEEKAAQFLKDVGIENFTKTYYETQGGVIIFNFAGRQIVDGAEVTLYTDLIKVGIALDDGEVISADARGYIVNHTERNLKKPTISEDEAKSKIAKNLTAESTKLCVIPSNGLNERFVYEVKTKAEDGTDVLVYINTENGREEQILLVKISGNGVLTV
ncbi:MAG: germination protein YpeB [Oscillospiraceae bacterium]|jgi:germination protein YpeB|nr:germination protein YpeB [Oscillospiraceae bacterium]